MKSLIAIAVMSLFLSAFQIIISGSALAAAAETEVKVFTYGVLEPLMSANPYVGENDVDYLFYGFIYDGLLTPGADGETRPNLVSTWWLLDGNTTVTQPIPTDFGSLMGSVPQNDNPAEWPMGSIWEYNLTEDVFWSDGQPFTADDVVFTIKMQIGSNYDTFWAYQPYTFWILDVQKVDDHKVRVFFGDPSTKVPVPVAWGYSMTMSILPEHALNHMTPTDIAFTWNGIPTIGLGPFTATDSLRADIISGESVTLIRNPYYNFTDQADGKQKGLGYAHNRYTEIDKLIMKFSSDESAMALDIKAGNVDVCSMDTQGYLAIKSQITESNKLRVQEALACTMYSYIVHWNVYKDSPSGFNPARLDSAFLRATAIATNQTHIIGQLWKGGGLPGVGLITPVYPEWYWTPGDEPSTFNVTNGLNESDPNYEILYTYTKPMKNVMDFDKELANEILDAAGYVWNAAHTLREIGPVAAERLKNEGFIANTAAFIGMDLSFDLLTTGYSDDIAIADYLRWEWGESDDQIGVFMEALVVNDATWSTMVYTYAFDYTITYWSGDDDPNYLLFVPTSYTIGSFNEFGTEDPYYDHLYQMQAKILNKTERMVWTDKCQEWQYLSGCAVYMYPNFGWAMNEQRWTNWGNFTEHPGLGPDHFWSESPWLFQIKWAPAAETPFDWPLAIGVVAILATIGAYLGIKRKRKGSLDEEGEEEDSGEPQED
jgi:ABC-type transport system substrate-binding protein